MANGTSIPPQGGVTINFEPQQQGVAHSAGQPSLSPQPPSETFVVPTNAPPQEVGEQPHVSPPSPRTQSGGKPIMRIIIILLILGLLIGAGVFGFGYMNANKQVTLTYWGLWENETIIGPVIAEFERQHPKIKVEYIKQSHKQYRERVAAAIDRGEGPDIFRFHNTWVPMLKNQLLPVPKTVMTREDFIQTYYPVAKSDLIGGTTIYGIPVEYDGLGLYINEDLFTGAGVSPPTTWEELLNIVPRLTVKTESTITRSAIALGTTGNVEHASDIIGLMMLQNGARLTDPTGKEAEEALIFYRKFADPADPIYTWNASLDNSIYAFAMGRVAMILAPSWRAFDIKHIAPNTRFRIVPVPQLPGNTVNWASYWVEGVSAKTKYSEQAWEFIRYLTSKEGATTLFTEAAKTRLFGEPYARIDMASSVTGDPYLEAYLAQAPTARSFPLASRTFDNGLNDKLIKYIEDAINSVNTGASPNSALQTVASGFRQVLSQYGLVSASAPAGQ